jgi:EPS-associated MarR family transcriptional regulator
VNAAPEPEQPTISDPTPLHVMRTLADKPRLSQRELAGSLGISLGKLNYILRALIAKGFVKAENYRKSTNKLAYLYLLTPRGVAHKADLTRRYIAIKMQEYEALRLEIENLERERERATEMPMLESETRES